MKIHSITRFISICTLCAVVMAALPLTRVSAFGDHLDDTLDGNGKLATDFTEGDDKGNAVAIQTDGKIIVAGVSDNQFAITRYNPNGSLDSTFSGDGRVIGPEGVGNAVAIQPDGKILVAGYGPGPTIGSSVFQVARFLANGNTDFTFNGTGRATAEFPVLSLNVAAAWSIAIQPDGYIVLAGHHLTTDTFFTFQNWAIARFAPSGLLDPLFSDDGKATADFNGSVTTTEQARAVKIMADGKILVAGTASPASNLNFALIRYNTNGTPDTSFDGDGRVMVDFGGNESANDMELQADGKIVLGGSSGGHFALARFTADGVPDTSFDLDGIVRTNINPSGTDIASGMVIQSDGKIVLAGTKRNGSEQGDFVLARYLTNGALDPIFGQAGIVTTDMNNFSNDTANALAIQQDRKLVVAGTTMNTGSTNNFCVARYLPNAGNTFFDFDGDDKTDIAIFRPSNGQWWIQRSGGGGTFVSQFGASTDKIVPADFTGDGKADIAFWRPSTGNWFVLRSENFSFFAFPFGTNGDIPVPADFDNDGKADPAVFRPSNGTWYLQRSTAGIHIEQFGAPGDIPLPNDYDGDARADLAIFRPSNGQWWLNRSTAGVLAVTFGSSTDKPTPGDFTGDGKTDVAIWRPSDGFWFVLRSDDFSFFAFPFGAVNDIPAAGDYDNDGKVDAAVFRPSSATWYVQRSTAGTFIQQFGASTDKPVPNAYVP